MTLGSVFQEKVLKVDFELHFGDFWKSDSWPSQPAWGLPKKLQKSTFKTFSGKTLSRVIFGPWIDFKHQIWLWVTLRGSQAIFESSQKLHSFALPEPKSKNCQFQWAPHHHQYVSFGSNFISAVQRDRFSSHIIFVQNWNFGGDVELTEIGHFHFWRSARHLGANFEMTQKWPFEHRRVTQRQIWCSKSIQGPKITLESVFPKNFSKVDFWGLWADLWARSLISKSRQKGVQNRVLELFFEKHFLG